MLSFIGKTIFCTLVTRWLAIKFGILVRLSEDNDSLRLVKDGM